MTEIAELNSILYDLRAIHLESVGIGFLKEIPSRVVKHFIVYAEEELPTRYILFAK